MEVTIKRPWNVITIHMMAMFPRAIGITIIAGIILFIISFAFGVFGGNSAMSQMLNISLILLLVVFVGYLTYCLANIIQYAKSARIKMSADAVQLFSRNIISANDTSLPTSQINNVSVDQNLVLKLMGLSQVTFTTDNGGVTSSWGFNFEDAQEFAEEFRKKYRIKITQ